MTGILPLALLLLAAYLIGGIPFGYLIARTRGVDLFQVGSGNIGATNVGRILGKRFGILVFGLDFAKGALPAAAGLWLAGAVDVGLGSESLGVGAGLAAILGHLFPVYLRFRGGKGVATGAGVVTVLLPVAALLGLLVWVGVVSAVRYVSAASLAAAVTLCLVRLLTTPAPFAPESLALTLFCFAAAGLVIVRHRANIRRLLDGSENRLMESATMQSLTKTIHVLALGLWFGMVVFFTFFVGLPLFTTMETLVAKDSPAASWLVVPAPFSAPEFNQEGDAINGRKEYGSRLAGYLISPMFGWYYLLQGVCGFLAIATAWGWQNLRPARMLDRLRVSLLLVALATVVLGWPLERQVSALRDVRQEKMGAYFHSTSGDRETSRNEAVAARSNFVLWHSFSLVQNFATLALVTVTMALAARLPQEERKSLAAAPEESPAHAPS
jgi:acyl-phosphate glycerol 3-phosphate acyltransferase